MKNMNIEKEEIFIEKFRKDKEIYEKWGNYVKTYILNQIIDYKLDPNKFLKIPLDCRIKDEASLISKAFYRGKKYTDPYKEIQDKVGMRFVVLYLDDIEIIKGIVENCTEWSYSKDKDFQEERDKNPEIFGYESVHYIVSTCKEMHIGETLIPEGLPCEIQIRTLMQHAYCEMSHSIMYKQKVRSEVKRETSRSMALIESADIFFKEVKKMVARKEDKSTILLEQLNTLYYSLAPKSTPEDKMNDIILDALSELIYDGINEDIVVFVEKHRKILQKNISKYCSYKLIFRQPIILLVAFLIKNSPSKVKQLWPLPENQIKPIYIFMGISYGI